MHYFVSDIHLGAGTEAESRATERRFVAWLDRIAADAETLVLAGDIFDFWFEYKRVVPKGFVRTLGRLAALTDRGIRVIFFTGNHDMWLTDYLVRECGVEICTTPQLLTFNGRRIFVAHGDNMQIQGQWLLQTINTLFRSRKLRWLFSWGLHPDLAIRFGRWWSGRSRKRHGRTPIDASVTEPLIAYARNYAAGHAVDDFLFGHMHYPRDYRDGSLHVVLLGCWERGGSYATLDAAGELTLHNLTEA